MTPQVKETASKYWPLCKKAGEDAKVPPLTLLAIMWRESLFGYTLQPQGPAGTGDGGHGRGLMQIDDRWHTGWLSTHDWTDPAQNIARGATILRQAFDYFRGKNLKDKDLENAAVAAYNGGCTRVWGMIAAGHDPDDATTGRDYSKCVTKFKLALSQEGIDNE